MSAKTQTRVMRKGGVVTIPWQFREQLGLEADDILELELRKDGILLKPTGRKFE